jgi:hypothetical protein
VTNHTSASVPERDEDSALFDHIRELMERSQALEREAEATADELGDATREAMLQKVRDVARAAGSAAHAADQIRTAMSDQPTSEESPATPTGLLERLARVEASIEGLRHSQNLTIAATVGVGAMIAGFIIAFGIYGLQRIDAVDNKIDTKLDALTARIADESARTRQDLIGITTAISNSITAARQMQAPPPPPTPSPEPKQQPPRR